MAPPMKNLDTRPQQPVKAQQPEMVPTVDVTDVPAPVDPAVVTKTALQLLDHLRTTGTPEDKLRAVADALAEQGGDKAPAAAALKLLEFGDAKILPANIGTVKKAGLWLNGPSWQPDAVLKQAPAEQLEQLRDENGKLRKQVDQYRSRVLQQDARVTFLEEENRDMLRQVRALKVGHPNAQHFQSMSEKAMAGVEVTGL